jgi:PPOX class probable F420-dependent enzyme
VVLRVSAVPAELDGASRRLITERHPCFLATQDETGLAHVVPMWVDLRAGRLCFSGVEGRRWLANARRDPRVTVTVVNGIHGHEYAMIIGRVARDTPDVGDAFSDSLWRRYLGAERNPFAERLGERVLIEVEPLRVVHFARA